MAIHYEIPGFQGNHLAKAITSGGTVGAVTRDASGFPILVPSSQGNLNPLLFRPTYDSRVAGQSLFLEDPNCYCIDPMQAFILNPKAWAEPAAGQFGGGALSYNDYRQQRLPDEQLNLGRTFRIRERMSLQVRAEFAAATPVGNAQGNVFSGFGAILMGNRDMGENLRTGPLIARITF